jgi:hypothetical protein
MVPDKLVDTLVETLFERAGRPIDDDDDDDDDDYGEASGCGRLLRNSKMYCRIKASFRFFCHRAPKRGTRWREKGRPAAPIAAINYKT